MSSGIIVAIVAIVFVGMPAVVLHFITEWKKTNSLSSDDERLIEDLWKTAQKLEKRVESLETILDQEAPDWRKAEREEARGYDA